MSERAVHARTHARTDKHRHARTGHGARAARGKEGQAGMRTPIVSAEPSEHLSSLFIKAHTPHGHFLAAVSTLLH